MGEGRGGREKGEKMVSESAKLKVSYEMSVALAMSKYYLNLPPTAAPNPPGR